MRQVTFWELLSENKISIPMIQRDYAQGRNSARQIREAFLDRLRSAIEDKDDLNMDFVYGSVSDNVFDPLDGQQRLTTLFLLHWYFAFKEGKTEAKKMLSKFTYQTRRSSERFCSRLAGFYDNTEFSKNTYLSAVLEDQGWFSPIWKNDPTVASMLNMLDAIHVKFFDVKDGFNKLTNNKHVTFNFIELAEFGLDDDLYVKMNARGKPLTEFEIFKSALDKKMRKYSSAEMSQTEAKSFIEKLDGKWLDLFFSLSEIKFDDLFLSFFIRVIEMSALIESDEKDLYSKLVAKRGHFSFEFYAEYITPKLLRSVNKFLDALSDKWINGGRFLRKNVMFDEQKDLMTILTGNSHNYTESVIVYAFFGYLASGHNVDVLSKWMRVVSNAARNIFYHNELVYLPSLKFIHSLLPQADKIEDYLSEQLAIKTSNEDIWEEERQKAMMLVKDESWRALITRAEQYSEYANGQIRFLLRFSEITPTNIFSWTEDDSKQKQTVFLEYLEKTEIIFGKDGIIHKRSTGDLFRRALLTIVDYLLTKSSNYSFLIHTDQRDISFKALLRNADKNLYVKQLFDVLKKDVDFATQLQAIIDNSSVDDWREYFIKHSQIMNQHCGQHNIRWNSDKDIIVLAMERMNGEWCEYYTTALYYEIKDRLCANVRTDFKAVSGNIWYFSFGLRKGDEWLYIAYNRGKGDWRLSEKKYPKNGVDIEIWLSDMDAVKRYLIDNAWMI